jgi:hypothetical protein
MISRQTRISILPGAVIGSNVYANLLSNAGTITGAIHNSVGLPVSTVPPFEATSNSVSSASDVNVGNAAIVTIQPGTYRDATVQPHGTLRLAAGVYHFRSLYAKSDASIL